MQLRAGDGSTGGIRLYEGGSERMRISAGKVFMSNTGSTGTASALLHLKGTGDAIRVESTNTGVGGAQVDLIHYTTSPADNDIHGVINFGGYYSGTDAAYGSSIRSVWSDVSAKEGQLEFWTRDDSEFAQRLKIDHDGTATFSGLVSSVGVSSTIASATSGYFATNTAIPANQIVHVRDDVATTSVSSAGGIKISSSPGNDVFLLKRWDHSGSASYFSLRNNSNTEHLAINMASGDATFAGDATFTGTITSSTSSTTDPVLRLTDTGVADYDVTFPDTSTYRLSTNTTSTKNFHIHNVGSGGFTMEVDGRITAHGDLKASAGKLDITGVGSFITHGTSWGQNLKLTNTNDDLSPPILTFLKHQASGHSAIADNDYVGFTNYRMKNTNGDEFSWVELSALAKDVTDGNESSQYRIGTWGDGTEYANTISALKGQVAIGTETPDARLHVKGRGGLTGLTVRTTDASNNETFFVQDGGRTGVRYWPFSIGIPSSTDVATNAAFQVEELSLIHI